jgi:hypothetical protein
MTTITIANEAIDVNIEHLALEEKQITDLTPLHSLTSLKTLFLCHNKIIDITPISALTNLTTLSF